MRSFAIAAACVILVGASCTPKEPVEIGAACSQSDQQACAVGKGALCRDGKWQAYATCTGPKGCYRFNVRNGTATFCEGGRARAGATDRRGCPA